VTWLVALDVLTSMFVLEWLVPEPYDPTPAEQYIASCQAWLDSEDTPALVREQLADVMQRAAAG
jgi:hypothetical protein